MDVRAAALAALVQFQVTETTVGQALQRIADITQEAVPSADVVGMSMLGDDGQPTTAVYTEVDSPEIDRAQYREGKGPCLNAWRHNVVVRVSRSQDAAQEFPAYEEACRQHGVRSTLSLPMRAGKVAVGALNLYARVEDGFSADDESLAAELAAAGAAVLQNVSAYWTAFDLSAQLSEALNSRAVIDQAKGMLMAQTPGLGAEGAFELLRQVSQRENVKLRDVARRIVDRASPGAGSGESR
ncbi:MAG: hypothetical protein JWO60_1395 [Frankiales bacterium]|nr:hypothetical protein [Frankiales bacterium]